MEHSELFYHGKLHTGVSYIERTSVPNLAKYLSSLDHLNVGQTAGPSGSNVLITSPLLISQIISRPCS